LRRASQRLGYKNRLMCWRWMDCTTASQGVTDLKPINDSAKEPSDATLSNPRKPHSGYWGHSLLSPWAPSQRVPGFGGCCHTTPGLEPAPATASFPSIGPTSDDANATSAFDMTSPAPPSSEGSNYLFSVSHNPWARASTRVRNLSVATRASQSTNGLTAEEQVLDTRAVAKWIGATALQWLLMCGALGGLQFVTNQMTVVCSGVVASTGPKVLVGLFFAFCSLRSRVFSPLDNSRPKQADEGKAIQERKRPSWMPPPLAFPIIWTTIAVLRTVSSVIVWEACGRELLVVPLVAMCLHLSIGDTWNTINNVERRLGTAVLGVGCVWLSVIGVDYLYFQTQTLAGALLAPSCLWITIATFLVYTIWGLNGKEPMLPMKSVSA